MPHQSHYSRFDNPNNILWGEQIMINDMNCHMPDACSIKWNTDLFLSGTLSRRRLFVVSW
jgi:hypothetical protein